LGASEICRFNNPTSLCRTGFGQLQIRIKPKRTNLLFNLKNRSVQRNLKRKLVFTLRYCNHLSKFHAIFEYGHLKSISKAEVGHILNFQQEIQELIPFVEYVHCNRKRQISKDSASERQRFPRSNYAHQNEASVFGRSGVPVKWVRYIGEAFCWFLKLIAEETQDQNTAHLPWLSSGGGRPHWVNVDRGLSVYWEPHWYIAGCGLTI